ncbi:MAG: hypothetical protein ABSD47_09890 [Candidatus Methylomirabilota bacterium]
MRRRRALLGQRLIMKLLALDFSVLVPIAPLVHLFSRLLDFRRTGE